jgi:hypothetical protein
MRELSGDPGNGVLGVEIWDTAGVGLRFLILSSTAQALLACRSNGEWLILAQSKERRFQYVLRQHVG